MMKAETIRKLAFICALCFMLCGCGANIFENDDSGSSSAELPEPPENTVAVGTGDSTASYSEKVTLYYRASGGRLVSEYRLIHVYPGNEPAQLVLSALSLKPYYSADIESAIPEGVTVTGCRVTEGIATVELSADAAALADEDKYLLHTAICNSLLSLPGIECAEVRCEGRALEISALPAGAEVKLTEDAAAGYLQRISESILADEGGTIERNAVIYAPVDLPGKCVPRCVKVDIISGDALAAAAEAAVSLCAGAELIECSSEVELTGVRTAEMKLSYEGSADLESIAAAAALSVCSFVPNTDCAEIEINGVSYGKMTYSGLRQAICSEMELYIPGDDGLLHRSNCVFDGTTPSARDVLRALIDGDVFPEGTDDADIMGIHIEDGIAYVNMSARLYSLCVTIDETDERLMIYSIVNSLCANDETLYAVRLLVDDSGAEVLAHDISLLTPLMPDPGLCAQ